VTRTLLAGALCALLIYGFIEIRPLLVGPVLSVRTPTSGAHYTDGIVTIAGNAQRATSLTLDGSPILPDQDGRFERSLAFPRGTSILTLAALDRFGRKVSVTRTIYVP